MKILLNVAVLCLFVCVSGCATVELLPPSSALPAAKGETKVSVDINGNSLINLKVQYFAPPENLQPPKSVYLVWVETVEGKYISLGQMLISEKRSGEISATTPFKTFRILISAEDSPDVATPSSQVVMRSDLIQAK